MICWLNMINIIIFHIMVLFNQMIHGQSVYRILEIRLHNLPSEKGSKVYEIQSSMKTNFLMSFCIRHDQLVATLIHVLLNFVIAIFYIPLCFVPL